MKKYLKKNVVFSPENESDMELYKQLQALPYGEFTSRTKELWRKELCNDVQEVKHIKLSTERTTEQIKEELIRRMNGGKIGD